MIAIFYRNPELLETPSFLSLRKRLSEAGLEPVTVCERETAAGAYAGNARFSGEACDVGEAGGSGVRGGNILAESSLIVSLGGDGTFLSAARLAAPLGIPVLGANMGRLGFLSENRPEDVAEAIIRGDYRVEDSPVLSAELRSADGECRSGILALNEITVHRSGPAMIGVDASINGNLLPTYWADGLIVATGIGSTAYSLSAGGPIAFPDSGVLLVTPISPHNLNVRPLIIPESSSVELRFRSRDPELVLSADNVNFAIAGDSAVRVGVAQFSLKRARLRDTGFINALTSRLYWGEDVRNH